MGWSEVRFWVEVFLGNFVSFFLVFDLVWFGLYGCRVWDGKFRFWFCF